MTLTTHAVIGGVIITSLPQAPLVGFLLAFGSHFLADAIPHWDYHLTSHEESPTDPMIAKLDHGPAFHRDLLKIGADFILGFLLATILATWGHFPLWLVWLGVGGGMLPDALQFFYYRLGGQWLTKLQRFHMTIHAKIRLNHRPLLGISLQGLLIVLLFYLKLGV